MLIFVFEAVHIGKFVSLTKQHLFIFEFLTFV